MKFLKTTKSDLLVVSDLIFRPSFIQNEHRIGDKKVQLLAHCDSIKLYDEVLEWLCMPNSFTLRSDIMQSKPSVN